MASYRLSQTADEDLDRLYEYGVLTFGLEQADHYYDGLIQRFQELVETPRLWQAVDHIRAGYRRSVYGSHSIYYRIDGDAIEIMRILRHEDIKTQLWPYTCIQCADYRNIFLRLRKIFATALSA